MKFSQIAVFGLFFVLFIGLFIGSDARSAVSRRRSRERLEQSQRIHVQSILSTDVLSIHKTDHYGYPKLTFHAEMCPIITRLIKDVDASGVVKDKELSDTCKKDVSDAVGKFFMKHIYTKSRFIHTYRDNMKVEVSFDDVLKYNADHCKIFEQVPFIFTFPFFFMIFVALTIMSCCYF
jgi:hypothetical protein